MENAKPTRRWAIIVDDGYGMYAAMKNAVPVDFIDAPTAKAARKKFLRQWNGTWQARDPKGIRATEVTYYPENK